MIMLVAGMFIYGQTRTRAFVTALDQLMTVTAVITVVGVGLALLLRSGPAPASAGPRIIES